MNDTMKMRLVLKYKRTYYSHEILAWTSLRRGTAGPDPAGHKATDRTPACPVEPLQVIKHNVDEHKANIFNLQCNKIIEHHFQNNDYIN